VIFVVHATEKRHRRAELDYRIRVAVKDDTPRPFAAAEAKFLESFPDARPYLIKVAS
jgi:hypothetical protein